MGMRTRRGFFSLVVAFLAVLWAAVKGNAATAVALNQIQAPSAGPGLVGFDATKRCSTVAVGTGLNLAGGVLSAAPQTAAVRHWNVRLARDGAGSYPLPEGVRNNAVIHRNGVRAFPGEDYTIVSNVVTPTTGYPWAADDAVFADDE